MIQINNDTKFVDVVIEMRSALIEQGWTPPHKEVIPKSHPMEKYIELGLDMEFRDCNGENWVISRLKKTLLNENEGDCLSFSRQFYYKQCRLRPNHVHWWEGKSDINPIPNNCEWRYRSGSVGWNKWQLSNNTAENTLNWLSNGVLAFEVRY